MFQSKPTPDCCDGAIRLQLALIEDKAVPISVSDDGVGLPADFNPALAKRLGTRIVQALAGQLKAELTRQESSVGTHYTLVVPLHVAAVNLTSQRLGAGMRSQH